MRLIMSWWRSQSGARIMSRRKSSNGGVRRPQFTCLLILEISVYLILSVQNVSGRPHNTSTNYSHHPPDDPFIISYHNSNNNNNKDYNNNYVNNSDSKNNNEEEHSDLMEELKEKILQDLGFEEIPSNRGLAAISKEEYLRAYTEYMFNVRRRRERQRGEPNNAKHRRKHAEIFLQSIEPLKQELQQDLSYNETKRVRVTFHLNRSEEYLEGGERRTQVRQATFWMPQHCQVVTNQAGVVVIDPEVFEADMLGTDVTKNVSRWLARIATTSSSSQVPHLSFSLDCTRTSEMKGTRLEIVWRSTEKKRRSRRHAGRGRPHYEVSDFAGEKFDMGKKLGKKRGKDPCFLPGGKKAKRSCCRKSLEVSFADLRIKDFILAPNKFDMDYCEGKCNARVHQLPYASNHAIFQHILMSNGPGPKLCCSPTKLSEVDVVQRDPLDPQSLKVTVIHNAKVEECGCA